MAVAVVTDTCHYLPADLVAGLELREVSLYVHRGARQDREADLDLDEYYRGLRTTGELPTTSQPSVGDFLGVYDPLLAEGHDVVSIHLSGGLSGTVQSATQAREQVAERGDGDRVAVLDSSTACGGEGLMVLAAAHAARQGGSLTEVAEHAQAARQALKQWFCIDTLEFLKRGGRIGGAQAWLGSALRIKPILTVESEITPVERVRTSGRAFERMVEYLRSRHEDGADAWVVQHIQAPDQAALLVDRGREIFSSEPLFVSEVGPVIGTHVGPGLLGVGGVPRRFVAAA